MCSARRPRDHFHLWAPLSDRFCHFFLFSNVQKHLKELINPSWGNLSRQGYRNRSYSMLWCFKASHEPFLVTGISSEAYWVPSTGRSAWHALLPSYSYLRFTADKKLKDWALGRLNHLPRMIQQQSEELGFEPKQKPQAHSIGVDAVGGRPPILPVTIPSN